MNAYDTEIAQGRSQAASLATVETRSCATDAKLNDRIAQWAVALIAAEEPYEAGLAAFEVQRNLDILHVRALGMCPGCARDAVLTWVHQPTCPALV